VLAARKFDRCGRQKRIGCYPTLWQKVGTCPTSTPPPLSYLKMLTRPRPAETPQHGSISWHKVAAHLPGRNNKDCRKRWHYSIAHTIRKGTWTKEEDGKLLQAVEKYGARWSKVAVVVGSRNGDQCWKRWYDCLDPRIDKSPWTADEVSGRPARGDDTKW